MSDSYVNGSRNFDLSRWGLIALPVLSATTWLGESTSNAYAVSEYFLDYRHGFLKRALIGELLSPIYFLSGRRIHLVEIASVLLAIVLSYVSFLPLLRSTDKISLLVVFCLCSPGCIPHFAAIAAQPDVILYSLLMVAYISLVHAPKPWAALIALVPCLIGILVHESFPLLFYPAILAILWDGWRNKRFGTVSILIHLLIFAGFFLAVMRFGQAHVDSAILLREALNRTDLKLDDEVFAVLGRGLAAQWKGIAVSYSPKFLAGVFLSVMLLLPVLRCQIALLLQANRARLRPLPAVPLLTLVWSPMLLCMLGHDVLRWLAGVEVSVVLILMYLTQTTPILAVETEDAAQKRTIILWMLYSLAIGPMGGATIRFVSRLATMLTT